MVSFSQAVENIKNGIPMQRFGWNGKGMFIFMRPVWSATPEQFAVINSVPQIVKEHILAKGGSEIVFTPYLCMYAADGTIVNGWLASQTDILAEDWQTL